MCIWLYYSNCNMAAEYRLTRIHTHLHGLTRTGLREYNLGMRQKLVPTPSICTLPVRRRYVPFLSVPPMTPP